MRILSVLARDYVSCKRTFGQRFWLSDNLNDPTDVSKPNLCQRPIYIGFHTWQIQKCLSSKFSPRKRLRSHPAWGGSVWASTGVHYSVLSHRQWESQVSQTEVGHSRCPLCPRVPSWTVHIKLLLTCEWLSGVKGSHLVKWGMSSGHCPPWFWDVILTYSWIIMGLHSPYLPQDP